LEAGDCVYLFTDGYADQFGGSSGKKFKYKQFHEVLIENYEKPMGEQYKILDQRHQAWKGALEQVDDILVIGFRV
jgi:serine phosphatase RsbU (regulator of sigma subunit)